MTSLFQARRRAEDFAAAVDGRAAGRRAGDEEITRLLRVVDTLQEQPLVEPRAEFAADLRSRLMLEAETALRPQTADLRLPVRERGRRERRLAVAASAFVLVGGTTTMAAAAQSALPGDALYPIKRGIEQVEAGLNLSPAAKGGELLEQASGRLAEVEGLLASDSSQSAVRVPETLTAFSEAADEGSTLMFEAFGESSDPATIVEVRTFAAEGIATLERLAPEVPADAQDELTAAAILLGEIDKQAAGLCTTCAADLPLVEVPDVFLARAEVDRALRLTAGRDLLNDHPVQVPDDLLAGVRDAVENLPAPTPAPAPTDDGDQATPEGSLPAPPLAPGTWPSLLPDLDGGSTTSESGSDVAEKVQEDVEKVVDGVTTLLPETDTDLLD
ncbi:MAG TPA: DUF5667 domain-containing protein [Nocardioidaceae bacterium]